MNKLKIWLVLLHTFSLLLAGAFFPRIVSTVQDYRSTGRITSSQIPAVALKIKKDLSPVARLIMFSNADNSTEVTESIAAMTKEEALAATRAELTPYIDAGLIEYSEAEVTLAPILLQASFVPDLQGIVWYVHIMGDAGGISNINIVLDDDTGHILQIEYSHENLTNIIPTTDAVQQVWADIFFSALELDYLNAQLEAEYVYDNAEHVSQRYAFADPEYGEVFVDLFLYPYGFSIKCSP